MGISSSQLTNSYFSEGLKPSTRSVFWIWGAVGVRNFAGLCEMTQRLRSPKASFGVNAGVLSREWLVFGLVQWIGLGGGEIYRKPPYLMVKTMVSCKFSLKPIHWLVYCGKSNAIILWQNHNLPPEMIVTTPLWYGWFMAYGCIWHFVFHWNFYSDKKMAAMTVLSAPHFSMIKILILTRNKKGALYRVSVVNQIHQYDPALTLESLDKIWRSWMVHQQVPRIFPTREHSLWHWWGKGEGLSPRPACCIALKRWSKQHAGGIHGNSGI